MASTNSLDDHRAGAPVHAPRRGHRTGWVWVAAIAVAVLAGVIGGVLVATTGDQPGPTATTTPSADTSVTSPGTAGTATTAPGGTLFGVPVYWVGESMRSFRLYREFRDVPDVGGPVASAVAAMTRLQPLDPDYLTPWRPAQRVAVTRSGQTIVVDLSADAFAGTQVGSELAAQAVQQLVYTATAAAAQAGQEAAAVTILVDGAAADVWGVLRVGEPIRRALMAGTLAHVWVTDPMQGSTVNSGQVRFTGYGTSFEANFPWTIRSADGRTVASGFTMGGSMGRFGEFAFTANLDPGDYTVEVSTDDPSGGQEGFGPATDDKEFTVQ